MKSKTIALDIELKQQKNESEQFIFNETTIHAIASGLSAVCEEVFIWSSSNHLAVWIVGAPSDFLVKTFEHFKVHYKRDLLLFDEHAAYLFRNIAEGNQWADCTAPLKFDSFYKAYDLSQELESLGPTLKPLVKESFQFFNQTPRITGSRNSYNFSTRERNAEENFVQVKSKDLFYRLGTN